MSALTSWSEEKQSVYLYLIIASKESNPAHKKLFLELANAANKQAGFWEKELKKSGEPFPTEFQPNARTKLVGWLVRHFGTKRVRFILSAMKVRGMSIYLSDHIHEKLVTAIPDHETRHKGLNTAGNLRAAVFGVNDGLLSNVSLILGVAGAQSGHYFIVLTGIAGLLAGACSMAAGEYISMQSQREFFEYQIGLEKSELEEYPEEEELELALIYEARGLPKAEAAKLAKVLISNPDHALDTLAREELGLNPNELGSPWGAAISSFFSFSAGAMVPLIPFLFGDFAWNLLIAIGLTSLSLFLVGATLSLYTSSNALKSGLRMLFIGVLAGSVTYIIGNIIGVTMH